MFCTPAGGHTHTRWIWKCGAHIPSHVCAAHMPSRLAGRAGSRGKASAPPADDNWEKAGGAGKKKGKPKKAVDPSLLGFSVESSRIMQGELQFVDGM